MAGKGGIKKSDKLKTTFIENPKGQLISKCPFGAIVSTKIPTEKFDKFCPTHSKPEFVEFFRWYFGQNDETKRTF